jgi:hypothetical protein
LLEPLRKFGSPIADLVSGMPYPAMQEMIDGVAPSGRRSYMSGPQVGKLTEGLDLSAEIILLLAQVPCGRLYR